MHRLTGLLRSIAQWVNCLKSLAYLEVYWQANGQLSPASRMHDHHDPGSASSERSRHSEAAADDSHPRTPSSQIRPMPLQIPEG